MRSYVIDTSVYGVLTDKHEGDYSEVRKIIEYAKRNRDYFVSTAIISKKLNSEDMDKSIRDATYPCIIQPFQRTDLPLRCCSLITLTKSKVSMELHSET